MHRAAEDSQTRLRLQLNELRDVVIVATLVVPGLYAGAQFLIPLTLAPLINVLIILNSAVGAE